MDFDGFSDELLGFIQFIGLHYTYSKFRIRFGPWKLILKALVLFGHSIKMDFGVILTHGPSFLVSSLNLSRILQVQQVLGLKIYINTTRHMPYHKRKVWSINFKGEKNARKRGKGNFERRPDYQSYNSINKLSFLVFCLVFSNEFYVQYFG